MNPTEDAIANYLTTLRRALKGLPTSECDEIVSEIRVHLQDAIQQPGAHIDSVISHLGPARELAAQYRENLLLQRTARALSPLLILQAVWRLARISVLGFVYLMLALLGYGTGAVMILSAFLKPVFPRHIGLWVGPGVFNFGVHDAGPYDGGVGLLLVTGSPAHDVLGWWYIPVALAIGAFFVWATTRLIRKLAQITRNKRPGSFLPAPAPYRDLSAIRSASRS